MEPVSSPAFNPSCPLGGQWYACGNATRFTGCCGEYPCTNTGCSAGLLFPASFEGSAYGTFPDQECSAGQFYSCNFTEPRFFGCCESEACASTSGCPPSSLAAAFLSNQPDTANAYDPQPPLSGAASSLPSSSSTSTSSGSTAAASAMKASGDDRHSTPVGIIAGGTVAGLVFLCVIALIIWRVRRHSKSPGQNHGQSTGLDDIAPYGQGNAYDRNVPGKSAMSGVTDMHTPYQDSPSTVPPYSTSHSPAPQYASPNIHPYMHQGHDHYIPNQILEADTRSPFMAYSPPIAAPYSSYTPLSQLSPPISHGYSHSRDSNTVVDSSYMSSSSQIQRDRPHFARVHQGPPVEMDSGDEQRYTGLGLHHITVGKRHDQPSVELDST